jgi:hypothetical protein
MNATNLPTINKVAFEEQENRLKVMMPLQRHWPYFIIYSILLLIWVGATAWMLGLLLGQIFRRSGPSMTTLFLIVYIIIILVWTYLWYRLGKNVWRYWQYYTAMREILFIDGHTLIVRRPLSILGVTDAYDMRHVSPFYYSDKNQAIAFEYGSRGGLFGQGLGREEADQLIAALNERFYPHAQQVEDLDEELVI